MWELAVLMCQSPQLLHPPHHLHLQLFRFGCFSKFFDQLRSIPSNRFVLNMGQGHHHQLRVHPSLFHDFHCFNVKVAAAHHLIVQKEVDELFAKGVIKPSSGGAGLYSSMFVVPKHTGYLWPILNLKHFYPYFHIPSFRCQLLDMCGCLFSVEIMLSPLIYNILIYIFLLLSIIIISYDLCGTICLINGRFYLLGQSQPSLNLFCSFVVTRVSVLLSIWMTSWSLFTLSRLVRGLTHFCVPYWFALDYILIFQV